VSRASWSSSTTGARIGWLQLARLDTAAAAALRAFVDASDVTDAQEPAEAAQQGGGEGEGSDVEASEDAPAKESDSHPGAASLHERIRNLSGAEQLRLASGGTLAERTALERMCGPTVWEPLLRNARVTIPEVARIARKGSLPRPLVDLVASNTPWLASGEVQRALLSNPRSSPTVIQKVLGAMSRHDLMLVPQQTAYPETVRAAAKKRLGR
jgi:hypothetical protein